MSNIMTQKELRESLEDSVNDEVWETRMEAVQRRELEKKLRNQRPGKSLKTVENQRKFSHC